MQNDWGLAAGGQQDRAPTSGLSSLLKKNQSPSQDLPSPSPTVNPHAGFHPASYGAPYGFSAAALGASSSNGSSSMGMSVSPPHWATYGNGFTGSGSFVGSVGALGTSFGRDRDRELEAKYVRDFSCCGRQLGGLHQLFEHYEEEHANLSPEVRMAALTAAQNSGFIGSTTFPAPVPPITTNPRAHLRAGPSGSAYANIQAAGHGEAPTPPGMMDIEMEESSQMPSPASMLSLQPQFAAARSAIPQQNPGSHWAAAFRAQPGSEPPQGVPPSLLSFTPPPRSESPRPTASLTYEQQQLKLLKKAQRFAERAALREEASASDAEGGEKRFPCPIEGCGKIYKQANGLKYHLTRSINSGHGNVAALGIAALLGDKADGMGD